MNTTKTREAEAFATLKGDFGYTSKMQAPRLLKAIVSTGVGKKREKKQLETISDRLARITGQKAAPRKSKISIASFKVREGDTVGLQVTLRGARMYDFLEKLIHIALPRTRDFRGIAPTAIDEMGNITIGIKENSIFPETGDEDLKDVFGLAVTIVTSAKSKKEAEAFLRHLGVPLRQHEEKKKK